MMGFEFYSFGLGINKLKCKTCGKFIFAISPEDFHEKAKTHRMKCNQKKINSR